MEFLNTYDTNWGAFRRIFVKQYSITYRYRVNQLGNKSTEIEIDMYSIFRKSASSDTSFNYLTERTNSELANLIVNKIDFPSATTIGAYLSNVLSSYIMTINFEESMQVFGVNSPVQCSNMLATCKCAEGYVHIKNLCVDIDQCSKFTSLCGNNECINTPGSYHCRSTETFMRRASTQDVSSPKFDKDSRIWRLYEKRLLNGKGRCISRDRQDKNIHFDELVNVNDSIKLLSMMKERINKVYRFCSERKRRHVNYSFEKAFEKLIKR